MKNNRKFIKSLILLTLLSSLSGCSYFGLKFNNSVRNPELDDNKSYKDTNKKRPIGNIVLMEKQVQKKLEKIRLETSKARKDFMMSESYPDLQETPETPEEFKDREKLKQEITEEIKSVEGTTLEKDLEDHSLLDEKPKENEENSKLLFNSGKINSEPLDADLRQKSPIVYQNPEPTVKTSPEIKLEADPKSLKTGSNVNKNMEKHTINKTNNHNYTRPATPKKVEPIIPQSRYSNGN